jgi:transcriptional regulator with XRE-family HTH domain
MQPPANDWSRVLQEARNSLHLSRAALAKLAGVSPQTIKAYELGLRHPTRPLLLALFDAMKLERPVRDRILNSAGYASIGAEIGPGVHPHYPFTKEQCGEYVERFTWPVFVVDDLLQIVCANEAAQCLWDMWIDDLPEPASRNMIQFASVPRLADRVLNWDEVAAAGISVFKGHHLGVETLDSPSEYFSQILERLMEGDASYVTRFFALWEKTEPAPPKVRWGYPVVWNEPDVGVMRLEAIITQANEAHGYAFNDWIPLDAQSWENLKALVRMRSGRGYDADAAG